MEANYLIWSELGQYEVGLNFGETQSTSGLPFMVFAHPEFQQPIVGQQVFSIEGQVVNISGFGYPVSLQLLIVLEKWPNSIYR